MDNSDRDEDLPTAKTTASQARNREADCKEVESFIDTHCIITDDDKIFTPINVLHQHYQSNSGNMKLITFSKCMKTLYPDKQGRKGHNGSRGFRGIQITS
jgi:hypothetical protein